jgi:hypothetical protein
MEFFIGAAFRGWHRRGADAELDERVPDPVGGPGPREPNAWLVVGPIGRAGGDDRGRDCGEDGSGAVGCGGKPAVGVGGRDALRLGAHPLSTQLDTRERGASTARAFVVDPASGLGAVYAIAW